MKTRSMAIAVLAALFFASMAARAEDRRYFDSRYSHNRYYPDRGVAVAGVPRGAYPIRHQGLNYWYHGGVWYRPRGRVSIVVGAPIGAFVPVLPPFFSTVWWRGVPYYYADNNYYLWDTGAREYKIVEAPNGIDSGGSTVAPPSDEVFIYPKNGQSPEQQDRDRYECHRFGVDQTGYDPTLPGGGVQGSASASKRSDYMRAQAACLEGRGYTVR